MVAPKGFTQQLTKESYVAAQSAAAKKRGVLRFVPPMIMGAAALFVLGVWTIVRAPFVPGYLMTGLFLAACAVVLSVFCLAVFPARAKERGNAGFALYDALYGETVVTFSSDEMMLVGEKLSRRVEYAKTRLCMETAEHFLIFTDDDTVVVLEKSAFADARETTDFLRTVFARWYVRKGRAV